MDIQIICHAGHRGEESPRILRFKAREVRVAQVLKQWIEPDHRMFTVLGHDGVRYTLRRDDRADTWVLIEMSGRVPRESKN